MKAARVFRYPVKDGRVYVRYPDGVTLSKDALEWRTVEARQRALVVGWYEEREDAERARLEQAGDTGRKRHQELIEPKHQAVLEDYRRFVDAFAHPTRGPLLALLSEFKVEGRKRAQFSERNIAAAVARQHKLTSTRVRELVRTKRKLA